MNYTELKAAIEAFSADNDDSTFVDNIPVFVKNAEKRIYQAVKIPALRKNQVGTFQQANPYLTLPDDYLSYWEVAVIDADGNYTYLINKDVSFIREAYPVPSRQGIPKYFSQLDNNSFLVAPTPAADYSTQLHYFYYPESIVTAETTWLGDNFDGALLYGSLVEAAAFMKSEQDIVKQYSEQYAVNLKLLKEYSENQIKSGAYRR